MTEKGISHLQHNTVLRTEFLMMCNMLSKDEPQHEFWHSFEAGHDKWLLPRLSCSIQL